MKIAYGTNHRANGDVVIPAQAGIQGSQLVTGCPRSVAALADCVLLWKGLQLTIQMN
jgi:hypothetical protein